MIQNLTKAVAVIVSSTILTTLAVNAADIGGDFFRSIFAGILFSVEHVEESPCPKNMTLVENAIVPFCVDMYENSAGDKCIYGNPQNEDDTAINLSDINCTPVSEPNKLPWTNINLEQAKFACSKAGKRLATPSEWYKAAVGTDDTNGSWKEDSCNVANNRADGVDFTGMGMRCVSSVGAYDMVGNVWELVDGVVENGKWNNRILPDSGFVSGVDIDGIAYSTKSTSDEIFNYDKFWSDKTIKAEMMRGGYYNNQTQAGLYSIYAASPVTFSGEAVGFRCVSGVNNVQ